MHVPVVLATREAEAGELLEPGRRQEYHLKQEVEVAVSLDWVTALHPGWQSETPSKKTTVTTETQNQTTPFFFLETERDFLCCPGYSAVVQS